MFYSWIYVIVNSLSALLRQISGNYLPPSIVLFIGCSIAVIYFHAIQLQKMKEVYYQCWQHKKQWMKISISVAFVWVCAIYSPTMIGASLYTFLFFSIMGALGTLSLYYQSNYKQKSYLISAIGLCLLITMAIGPALTNKHFAAEQIIGIVLACAGGIAGFIYSKQSSEFVKQTSISATQILAIRFYLTIAISIALMPSHPFVHLSATNLLISLSIGVFSLIIPLYLVQKGIETVGPEMNAIIVSITPFVATIFEELYFHNIDRTLFVICTLYSIFAILPHAIKLATSMSSPLSESRKIV